MVACDSMSVSEQTTLSAALENNPAESDLPKEDLYLIASFENNSEVMKRATGFRSASAHGIDISAKRVELDSLKQSTKTPFDSGDR